MPWVESLALSGEPLRTVLPRDQPAGARMDNTSIGSRGGWEGRADWSKEGRGARERRNRKARGTATRGYSTEISLCLTANRISCVRLSMSSLP
jgi:hypothetical protein